MASPTLGQVKWVLDVDTSTGEAKLRKFREDAKSTGKEIESAGKNSFGNFAKNAAASMDSVADSIGRVLKGAVALGVTGSVGIGAMTKAAFDQVREVENASFALRAYEKDAGKVNKVLAELVSFARSDTGVLFQRQELFKAASNLRAYGESADTVTDKVKILARGVALGTTTFDELSLIVGRAAQAGQLTAVAYDQLAYRGIVLDSSLRGAKVSSEQLYQALSDTLPASLLEGRANTIDGVMIRLQSAFRDLGSAILGVDKETSQFVEGGAGARLMELLNGLTKTLKQPEFKEAFKQIGEQIADLAAEAIPKLLDAILWLAQNFDKVIFTIKALTVAWVAFKTAAVAFKAVNTVITVVNGVKKAMDAAKLATTGFQIAMSGGNIAAGGGFFTSIGTVVAKVVTSFQGLATFVSKALPLAFQVGSKALMAIPVWGWILAAVVAIGSGLVWLYKNNEGFRKNVQKAWQGILNFFKGVGSFFVGLWDGLVAGLQAVGNFFATVFTSIYNFLLPVIQIVGLIVAVVQGLFTVVFTVFSAIAQIVWTVVSTIVQIIGVILYGSFLWLWNNVLVPTGKFFVDVFNGIRDVVSKVFNWVANFIKTIWNGIVSFLTPILNSIASFFRSVWNGIMNFIRPVVEAIKNYIINPIRTAIDWVVSNVVKIATSIGNAVSNAYNKVREWIGRFTSAGKDIIDGIVKGIGNAAGAVVNKVKEICSGALDAVKKFFGISSPSKVMAQQGEWLMEGLTNGIEDAGRQAVTAIKDVNTAIAGQMASSASNFNGEITGRMVAGSSASNFIDDITGGSGSGATINQTNNFYNADEPNMDKVNSDLTWQLNKL